MTTYPSNVRWLPYSQKRRKPKRTVSRETLRVAAIAVGAAAIAWGLMHLALRLAG